MQGGYVLLALVQVLDDAVLVQVVAELVRGFLELVVLEGDQLPVRSLGLLLQMV